jgi:hypothetical protein
MAAVTENQEDRSSTGRLKALVPVLVPWLKSGRAAMVFSFGKTEKEASWNDSGGRWARARDATTQPSRGRYWERIEEEDGRAGHVQSL